jgi:hypothetical protein
VLLLARRRITGRLAAEFAVILLGVLLALAADRWNQDRLERVQEADYVERLTADIRSDSTRAALYLVNFERIELARDSLLRFVDGEVELGSTVSTVMRAFQQFYLPAPATWNELLGGGSLGVIRDSRVRAIISEYYVTDRANWELQLTRSDRRGRDPFTDALYPMGLFLPCVGGQECAFQGEGLDGEPDSSPVYRAFSPQVFQAWPGIRELVTGLGSHHGSQRLFAQSTLRDAASTLEELGTEIR